MAHKKLLFHSEAREKVLRGATTLADAVRVTLGPKSTSVLIEKDWGKPIVCNDGVTIAKEIDLEDPEENLGAQVLREAAEQTGDVVGDGTTTATLLAHAILADGVRNVAAGASAVDLKRGLDRGLKVAVAEVRALSRPVQSRKEWAQVATVSAHNDPAIGDLVAEAMEKVGVEGAITVEEAKSTEASLEVVEGMQFDRGYLSAYLVTDPEKMEAVLESALVLLFERKIGNIIEATTSTYDREKLEERLAKLTGGVAVIRVGAPSEAELKNRKEAFDDAISATKVPEPMAQGGPPVPSPYG